MPLQSQAAIARFEREKAEQMNARREAVELRKNGLSFRKIAEAQGCTVRTATKRYERGLKEYVPAELVESARAIELDRFDALTQINIALLAKAFEAGDIDSVCKLQDKILAVHDRRANLIPIKVPQRLVVDATVETKTDQDRELSDLLGRMSAETAEKIAWLQQTRAE